MDHAVSIHCKRHHITALIFPYLIASLHAQTSAETKNISLYFFLSLAFVFCQSKKETCMSDGYCVDLGENATEI